MNTGGTNLATLIQHMKPKLNKGDYVFCSVKDISKIDRKDTLFEFKEAEGVTIVLEHSKAIQLGLEFHYIASWITLQVHSALEAVGLTAAFSNELAKHQISSNVVAGYFHDHIFVDKKNATKAINVLKTLSKNYTN
ncbi:ACT domain-containing protein [Geojedonia litorea]|uniref:ACT domain-containing protein n=1 Tax=Geojedonia litorea TaxID=1268269 RepID=A0ABV9N7T2_9FLAO